MKRLLYLTFIVSLGLATCSTGTPQTSNENPLLAEYNTPFNVPPFDLIELEHFIPAFEEGMKQKKAEIEAILTNAEEPTFENTIEPYFYSGELLGDVSTAFYAIRGLRTTDELDSIAQIIQPKIAAFGDEIRLDPRLFEKVKAVYEKKDQFDLDEEQAFLLENLYKGFIRSGADLPDDKKTELMAINQGMSKLRLDYSQNIRKENKDYQLIIENEADLAGLSESSIQAAAEEATKAELEGKWVFTISKPSMLPFLTYAENRDLREQIFKAYINKGNNNDDKDTKEIVKQIVNYRVQKAKLLGYESHAAYRTENRMAQTPEGVFNLLNQLWDAIIPVAKEEAKTLQAMIDEEGGDFKLKPWDWWYYTEKVRKAKYDLDDSELRPYFELNNVQAGAYMVAEKLYGITFEPISDMPKVHEEAQVFVVKEANGDHLGILYCDWFPRPGSKGMGAWCGTYTSRHMKDGEVVPSIVAMAGNFTRPTGDKPALISADEVETLFHEFGHALDNLFSTRTYPAGYVARDFVELPSQIMEHWAFEPTVLRMYAKHYETGEVIPDELIEKLKKSGNFNLGFTLTEVLAASLLDMKYHTLTEELTTDVMTFEKDYLDGIGLIPEIVSRYRSTYFGHMIGGYDAGYYAYTWSDVLDEDAFNAFKETSLFDQETAASFRENILAKNGIENALEMFKVFRGREPQIDALLENKGLK